MWRAIILFAVLMAFFAWIASALETNAMGILQQASHTPPPSTPVCVIRYNNAPAYQNFDLQNESTITALGVRLGLGTPTTTAPMTTNWTAYLMDDTQVTIYATQSFDPNAWDSVIRERIIYLDTPVQLAAEQYSLVIANDGLEPTNWIRWKRSNVNQIPGAFTCNDLVTAYYGEQDAGFKIYGYVNFKPWFIKNIFAQDCTYITSGPTTTSNCENLTSSTTPLYLYDASQTLFNGFILFTISFAGLFVLWNKFRRKGGD